MDKKREFERFKLTPVTLKIPFLKNGIVRHSETAPPVKGDCRVLQDAFHELKKKSMNALFELVMDG